MNLLDQDMAYRKGLLGKVRRFLSKVGDALEKPMLLIDKFVDGLPISDKAKKEFSVRKFGILGTVTFHLVVLVLILGFKISTDNTTKADGIEIDMKTLEELARMQMEIEKLPVEGEDNSRNIAVDQKEDKIESFEDYRNYQRSDQVVDNLAKSSVDKMVEEIIEENNLDPFNDELPDLATEELKMYRAEKMEEEQVYKGATNIYFTLEGRQVVHLEIPVYKCEGGGLVKVEIRVNRRGKVEWASIDTAESETQEQCLLDAAKEAAMKTRFNLNQSAPLLQQGSLTYRFIAQ